MQATSSRGLNIMHKKSGGFTLVEMIVVIAILGIIAAIAVPRLFGFKSMAEERVCNSNRKIVERMYTLFMVENEHEESVFNQFLLDNFDKICPASGVISYENGKVKCSVHGSESEGKEEEEPGEEVPWL